MSDKASNDNVMIGMVNDVARFCYLITVKDIGNLIVPKGFFNKELKMGDFVKIKLEI